MYYPFTHKLAHWALASRGWHKKCIGTCLSLRGPMTRGWAGGQHTSSDFFPARGREKQGRR